MRRFALAACAAALCSLATATAPAGAQLMSIDADARDWGLTSHEVRVLQFALRDAGCYEGRIDGRVGPGTRAALRCAHERTNTTEPAQLAQQMGLYEASFVATVDGRDTTTPTREAAGDVEMAPPRDTTQQMQPEMQPRMQMRDTTMMHRDTTMMPRRDTTMMPRRDTTMMPMRDSTMMPRRDTTMMPRPDTTRIPPPDTTRIPPRDSTMLPRPDTTRLPAPTDTTRRPPPR